MVDSTLKLASDLSVRDQSAAVLSGFANILALEEYALKHIDDEFCEFCGVDAEEFKVLIAEGRY